MVRVLANALGASVIAEGVETAGQRDRLLDLGCTQGQGVYYGRAMAPETSRAHSPPTRGCPRRRSTITRSTADRDPTAAGAGAQGHRRAGRCAVINIWAEPNEYAPGTKARR